MNMPVRADPHSVLRKLADEAALPNINYNARADPVCCSCSGLPCAPLRCCRRNVPGRRVSRHWPCPLLQLPPDVCSSCSADWLHCEWQNLPGSHKKPQCIPADSAARSVWFLV